MGENEAMFTEVQVRELVGEMVREFADAVGFRERTESEAAKDYRKALLAYLREGHKPNAVDPDVRKLIIEQLDTVHEIIEAHRAYWRGASSGNR